MSIFALTPSLDGYVSNLFQTTWVAVHDATSGTDVDKTSVSAVIRAEEPAGETFHMARFFLVFDLSTISGSAMLASDAVTLVTNITSITATGDDYKTLHLVSSTQASNTDLVLGDFDQRGSTNWATPVVGAVGSNTLTLNTTGRSALQSAFGGYFKMCIIMKYDFDNTDPAVGDGRIGSIDTVDNATPGNRPTLNFVNLDVQSAENWAEPGFTSYRIKDEVVGY